MTNLDPQLLSLLLLTTGVGYLMAYAGIGKNALEWKRRRTICPSCGRHETACSCAAR